MSNTDVIYQYFEAWNQGDLDVFDRIIAPDYVNHNPGTENPEPGPQGLKPIVEAMRVGFPDLRFEVLDVFEGEDRVAVRSVMSGTHSGELFGIPATGKAVRVQQLQVERLRDGLIVEHWRQSDDLGLMRQLGVVE